MILSWLLISNFEVVTQLNGLVGSFFGCTIHLESSLSESTEKDLLVFGSFFTDFLNLRLKKFTEWILSTFLFPVGSPVGSVKNAAIMIS